MKPFLLIQTRPEDEASENEYEAFLQYSKLGPGNLHRIRAEQKSMGKIDLNDHSGIIIGGGPFNVSDPDEKKSAQQHRVEAEILALLDEIIENDFPLLAICYGVGLVAKHQGGIVSTMYGEQMDAVNIILSEEGRKDQLLQGLPEEFNAFVAHKEACETLPDSAVLLASSNWCPVHMFRVKSNVYITQFHPEWDGHGLEMRVRTYMNHGYFQPEDADNLIAMGYSKKVIEPEKLLSNFVRIYSAASLFAGD